MSETKGTPENATPQPEKTPTVKFEEFCSKIEPGSTEALAASIYLQTQTVDEEFQRNKEAVPPPSLVQTKALLIIEHTRERIKPGYMTSYNAMEAAYKEFKKNVITLDPAYNADGIFQNALSKSQPDTTNP